MPTPNRPLSQNEYTEQNMGNTSFDKDFFVNTVQTLGYDGRNLQRNTNVSSTLLIEYDGSSNPVYIGKASPGTLSSEAFWQVKKLTFDGSGNVTSLKYAGGTPDFNSIWDDRASLTYI